MPRLAAERECLELAETSQRSSEDGCRLSEISSQRVRGELHPNFLEGDLRSVEGDPRTVESHLRSMETDLRTVESRLRARTGDLRIILCDLKVATWRSAGHLRKSKVAMRRSLAIAKMFSASAVGSASAIRSRAEHFSDKLRTGR